MTRREELDAMSEEDKQADILKSITEAGCIRITSKPQAAFWMDAINALETAGKVKVTMRDNETQQYSYVLVEPT